MKKFKCYAGILLLSGSLSFTTSGCSEVLSTPSVQHEISPEEREQTCREVSEALLDSINKTQKILEEQRFYERIAFEKACSNPEVLEREDFKNCTDVSLLWDEELNMYELACTTTEGTYYFPINEEKLISYIIWNTSCENISINGIKDNKILEELATIKKFKQISIYNAETFDLDGLSHFTELIGLRLYNCKNLNNIDFLEKMPELIGVEINGTNLSDLTPLSKCSKLKGADLRYNKFSNPEVLANLENLKVINLEYNQIKDISQLQSFIDKGIINEETAENIQSTTDNHRFIFSSENLESAKILSIYYLDALDEYHVELMDEENNVKSYMLVKEPYEIYEMSEKLENKVSLKVANVPNDRCIRHISDTRDYQYLVLSECDIESLSFVDDFDNLGYLSIIDCPSLKKLTWNEYTRFDLDNLKYLRIDNTSVSSLDAFGYLKNLEEVVLVNNNYVTDYEFLNTLDNLKYVSLDVASDNVPYEVINNLQEKGVIVELIKTTKSLDEKEKEPTRKLN